MELTRRQKVVKQIVDQVFILFGCLLVAVGLDLFLIPNKITAGGVSGIATILFYSFGLPVGMTMLVLNAVLFLVAFKLLGKEFGLRSLTATVVLSVLVDALVWIGPWFGLKSALFTEGLTRNLLLATIFGSIISGAGMAIVFLRNSSTGGTDIIARIINKYTEIPMGRCLLFVDAAVTVGAGFAFGAEPAMFAIIAIYVSTQAIDALIQGVQQGKKFLIVSERHEEICKEVLYEMGRGATIMKGLGGWTGVERPILLVVVKRRELPALKEIIRRHDPHAFVMVSDVYEILGEGFSRLT